MSYHESNMSEMVHIEVVRKGLDALSASDRKFAQSLLDSAARHPLSNKQSHWIRVLSDRVQNGGKPDVQVETVGDLTPILDMFASAKSAGLKHPKITFETTEAGRLQLSLSAANGVRPETINVTDGGPYGQNVWFGRIDKAVFEVSNRVTGEGIERVTRVLRDLAASPLEYITQYGKASGRCACCGRPLGDPKSVALGMGPVCKKKFGL